MKESRFIAQNKKKWIESEDLLADSVKDPEKLSNLFTQVVDDLSFSRTYYRHRSVRVYLNQLAREYFNIIYNSQGEKKNRFKAFWLDELPQLMIFSRKPMLISLIVFLLAVAMGVFSSIKDPDFASNILGHNYVEMTKENIKNGDSNGGLQVRAPDEHVPWNYPQQPLGCVLHLLYGSFLWHRGDCGTDLQWNHGRLLSVFFCPARTSRKISTEYLAARHA